MAANRPWSRPEIVRNGLFMAASRPPSRPRQGHCEWKNGEKACLPNREKSEMDMPPFPTQGKGLRARPHARKWCLSTALFMDNYTYLHEANFFSRF